MTVRTVVTVFTVLTVRTVVTVLTLMTLVIVGMPRTQENFYWWVAVLAVVRLWLPELFRIYILHSGTGGL